MEIDDVCFCSLGQALCVFRVGGVGESLGHFNFYRATLILGVVPFLNKGKFGVNSRNWGWLSSLLFYPPKTHREPESGYPNCTIHFLHFINLYQQTKRRHHVYNQHIYIWWTTIIMKTIMFSCDETAISEKYHYTGSKGVFCIGPFLFMAVLIDFREGRWGCGPWRSIRLACHVS